MYLTVFFLRFYGYKSYRHRPTAICCMLSTSIANRALHFLYDKCSLKFEFTFCHKDWQFSCFKRFQLFYILTPKVISMFLLFWVICEGGELFNATEYLLTGIINNYEALTKTFGFYFSIFSKKYDIVLWFFQAQDGRKLR